MLPKPVLCPVVDCFIYVLSLRNVLAPQYVFIILMRLIDALFIAVFTELRLRTVLLGESDISAKYMQNNDFILVVKTVNLAHYG